MAEDARQTQQKIVDLALQEAEIKKKIADQIKRVNDESNKNKQAELDKLQTLRQQKDVLTDAIKLERQIVELKAESAGEMKAEDLLTYDILQNRKKIKSFETQLNKLKQKGIDIEGDEYKLLVQQKKEAEDLYKLNSKAAGAAQMQQKIGEKTAETLGLAGGTMRSISSLAITLGQSLLTVKGAITAIVGGALVGFAMLMKDIVSNAKVLQENLKGSFDQMAQLRIETMGASKVLGFFGFDLDKSFSAIADNFGGLVDNIDKLAINFTVLSKLTGATVEDIAKITKNLMVTEGASEESARSFLMMQASLAKVNKLEFGKIMEDVAGNTQLFADFGVKGQNAMFRASMQARKLGLSLSTVAKLADKFMDFPNAIEDSFNLSTLLGVDLGDEFMRASMASISGNLPELMSTIQSMLNKDLFSRADMMGFGGLARKQFRDTFGFDAEEAIRMLKAGDRAGYESLFSKEKLDEAGKAQMELATRFDNLSSGLNSLNTTITNLINKLDGPMGGVLSDPTKLVTDPMNTLKLGGMTLGGLGLGAYGLSKTGGAIMNMFRGGGGKVPATPNLDNAYQTKSGRFKLPGMKGPGFKSLEGLSKKMMTQGAAKTAGKYMPFGVGTALRLGGIGAYAGKGDFVGAGIETLSALASFIPKIGTVAAIGLDMYNLNRHLNLEKESEVKNNTAVVHDDNTTIIDNQKTQTQVLRELVTQNKLTRDSIDRLILGD
jgi:hypothetical protein|tara:strand:- start:565 stop:2724 length:2160 start_codon:yes stop_codon:yes gene_type:complete